MPRQAPGYMKDDWRHLCPPKRVGMGGRCLQFLPWCSISQSCLWIVPCLSVSTSHRHRRPSIVYFTPGSCLSLSYTSLSPQLTLWLSDFFFFLASNRLLHPSTAKSNLESLWHATICISLLPPFPLSFPSLPLSSSPTSPSPWGSPVFPAHSCFHPGLQLPFWLQHPWLSSSVHAQLPGLSLLWLQHG